MSDDDDFLARWSRRKRAARSGEAEPDAEAAEETAAEPDPQPPAPAASEPAEPLPSVEDLTAESDLAAFLREGVPTALRHAAMRKMWSLDPVVRDYIGPSEYAWDFNQPGSMAGFGALESTPSVAGLLSTVSRVLPDEAKKPAPEPEAPPVQVAGDTPEQGASSVQPTEIASEAASTGETTDPAASAPTPSRPRHGGALPR